jgi:hypothetical protein
MTFALLLFPWKAEGQNANNSGSPCTIIIQGNNNNVSKIPCVPPPSPFVCEDQKVIGWLEERGAYGPRDRPFGPSVYDERVRWVVNGNPSSKTRSEVIKDEEEFRKAYSVITYTKHRSSAKVVQGQCVLTMQVDSYKRRRCASAGCARSNQREENTTLNLMFAIRMDPNWPRIVEHHIDVELAR